MKKKIFKFINLSLALFLFLSPIISSVEARPKSKKQKANEEISSATQANSYKENELNESNSSEKTTSSDISKAGNEINNSQDYFYEPLEEESDPIGSPFKVLALTVLCLAAIIGLMIWSNIRSNKKKIVSEEKSQDKKKSNFAILDHLSFESGKSLYLITIFDKTLIVGSSWNSVSLICELDKTPASLKEIYKQEEATEKNVENKKSEKSSLDFLTEESHQEKDLSELPILKKFFSEILPPAKFDHISYKDLEEANTLETEKLAKKNKKEASTANASPEKPIQILPSDSGKVNSSIQTSINEKYPSSNLNNHKKEVKTSFRDERKKNGSEQKDWKSFYSSVQPPTAGEIKRTYENGNETFSIKKPNWLLEREQTIEETERRLEEGSSNNSEKPLISDSTEAKVKLTIVKNETPSIKDLRSLTPERDSEATEEKENEELLKVEELDEIVLKPLTENVTRLRRKISIVED